MSNDSARSSRIVACDTPFRLISSALGRRHYTRRRARMRAENTPCLAIIPDDEIDIEILQHGVYERHLLSFLFDNVLAPFREEFTGKTALDIGANIGNHSIYFSQRFQQVISFEPGQVASHLLQANLHLNKITNVELHKVGLSDQETQAALMLNEADNPGSNTLHPGTNADGGETIDLRRGDTILKTHANLAPVALVKIDVEGHEAEAVRGFGYKNLYTLAKDLPFPNLRLPLAKAVLSAKYVLEKCKSLDDRYCNLAIATTDQDLI